MTVLHATEPATVYLSLPGPGRRPRRVADVDRALYDDRTLVKQLAMRRTLFVFPRDLLPAAWGSASARVADPAAARAWSRSVEAAGIADDGAAWLDAASAAVLARLADGSELSAQASCASRSPSWPAGSRSRPARRTAATSRSRPGC